MLVAFLMTLYAGILSPLDSGVQSTDTNSTLAQETQQVQLDPGRKPCDVAWPMCQPPNPRAVEPVVLTADLPDACGNVAWPDSCPPPRTVSVTGIEWPLAPAPDPGKPGGPGVEWPKP
ncbi:hypothetical protein [Allokutzneria oryzae]|uniref:Uncharacterized protein n=1 Tax=Allokutzneria oryzae TaxID=1378989 RepID=A0ABV5ZP33_9PSEU